ncbi:MAG: hypothetical protein HXL16_03945 [Peptostreptococcaceae bacterium]|nr:hypothetical protein [Peptostreptococcaceae bacterium]
MIKINENLIDNLLIQSSLLLEKSMLLAEDVKINKGQDIRGAIENKKDTDKIIDELIKESEQIRKNSSQVLSIVSKILELNNN